MISALVVDDSFFMRRLISDILESDPEIRVVGTASNGEEAVQAVQTLNPDVITMDLEMPKLDGLSATKRIMSELGPHPIVIMLSAFTKEQADVTLECLHAGAFDCILKPSGPLSLDVRLVNAQLITQVKAAAKVRRDTLTYTGQTQKIEERKKAPTIQNNKPSLIIIGASTGGPPILEQIFSLLPSPLPAPVLIVQHMPEKFTLSMAKRLDSLSTMRVKEAEEGEPVKQSVALIAPGDFHMTIRRVQEENGMGYRVHLNKDKKVNGMRPSIDVTMESACREFDGNIIGVLLSGMGQDGRTGMEAIKKKGGRTIVQEPRTCIVDSMPESVIKNRSADEVLPPEKIPFRLLSLALAD